MGRVRASTSKSTSIASNSSPSASGPERSALRPKADERRAFAVALKRQRSRGGRPPVRMGVIGVGTVGTGTIKVLTEHQREVERRLGCKLELKTICSRNIHKKDLSWLRQQVEVTHDWTAVVRDPAVDIVVELVSDAATARAIALAALDNRKHLVTANKELVAQHGVELVARARAAAVNLGIEACVAGGTPLVHAIREGLAGEHFSAVFGILNGTTNYILTEMERRGCTFAEALAEAQREGYAEPDPSRDVEGHDARYKIAILAMLCFGQPVRVDDIPVEGITRIDQVDFSYARRLDHVIRLIAGARRRPGGRLEIFVRPMMIPHRSQLAGVLGPINGILLVGDKGGNTMLQGRGAGGEPTGVAVLSDVIQIARAMSAGARSTTPLGYTTWHPARVASGGENLARCYLRLVVRDRPGILARVCGILAQHRINIDSVLQEPCPSKKRLPFVMTLEPTREKLVSRAVAQITHLSFLAEPPLMMPFAELP